MRRSAQLRVSNFFVMDENFLLYKKRALELLDYMRAHDKAWSMYVFPSANVLDGIRGAAVDFYEHDEVLACATREIG
jgi:hypothetical protein